MFIQKHKTLNIKHKIQNPKATVEFNGSERQKKHLLQRFGNID